MTARALFIAMLGATMLAGVAPAQAQFAGFLNATCGSGCADPVGEQASANQNWAALEAMGTTDFIGGNVNGVTIDASSLLAAARVSGPVELDRWLKTGQSSSSFSAEDMLEAITSISGFDLTGITGSGFSISDVSSDGLGGSLNGASLQNASMSGGTMLMGPGGGGSSFCDQAIDSTQNASAQQYINSVMQAAESEEMGFSTIGNKSVGSNSHGDSGLFGGSCLDLFMTGERDTLFRPPQLSELVSKMGQMFSAENEGNCATAPTPHAQIADSMPNAAFIPGNGGFFPGNEYGGSEAPSNGLGYFNGFGLQGIKSQNGGGTTSDLASLF